MKKLLFVLILLPLSLLAQDTTKAVLAITKGKFSGVRIIPGYVIWDDCKIVGYLTKNKKPVPKRFEIWDQKNK